MNHFRCEGCAPSGRLQPEPPAPLRRDVIRKAMAQLWLATWFFADGADLDAQLRAVELAEAQIEDAAA